MLRTTIAALAALLLLSTACGKSGERETRPVEVLFYANIPTGAAFEVVALQGENADHRFDGVVFEAPQLFVLENAIQPVRGIFKNVDPELTLVVELAFGTDLVNRQEIPPGVCCTVAPGSDCSQATEVCDEFPATPSEPEIRFDVYSIAGATHVGFSATLGDQVATNITACALGSNICLTPTTFFLEQPQDVVSGVFTKYSNQDPTAVLRADLYIDGVLSESASGTDNVVVSRDL